MNVQGSLEAPGRRRVPGAISLAIVITLAGASLFAVQSCVDPPAAAPPAPPTAPTASGTNPTPPTPPTPPNYPPPPT